MSQLEVAENNVAADTERVSSAYVPPLQRTEGQPPPIAANGGLSYMSFDRDGDAGTAAALEDALTLIAEGEGQRVLAEPGARLRGGDPAQERRSQPAAGPLFPAGDARRAAHRRVPPGPLARQPRMHGPARCLAGAPRVRVLELLRFGGGGARVLP